MIKEYTDKSINDNAYSIEYLVVLNYHKLSTMNIVSFICRVFFSKIDYDRV